METHLRLAERRGVLQGASLSPVQVWATEVLYLLDGKDVIDKQVLDYKLGLITTHPEATYIVFPEWEKNRVVEQMIVEQDTPDRDIEWGTPGTEEENKRIEALITAALEREPVPNEELTKGNW